MSHPTPYPGQRIGIIGAGITGLACASALRAAGLAPVLFDKGRGLGGRMATRRAGDLRYDHGAQFVTAKGPAFAAFLARAVADGAGAAWTPAARPVDREWIVGLPGMTGLLRPLAEGLDIRLGAEITRLEKTCNGWLVHQGGAQPAETFDMLLMTIPAPQAVALVSATETTLSAVRVAPCWALMFSTAERLEGLPDTIRPAPGNSIAWIARTSAKPGRPALGDSWVVHASPDWSRENLELDRGDARAALLADFAREFRVTPITIHAEAHRWRFAMTTAPLGQPYLDTGDGMLIGGDWCLGARAEAGFDSGRAMAAAVVARLGVAQPS